MKCLCFIVSFQFCLVVLGRSQEVIHWADRVINFSSEFEEENDYPAESKRYRAIQALGKPNVLPKGGSNPCAWSPASERSDSLEWIHLGFDNPIPIQQIAIAESHNPGGIVEVAVFDQQQKQVVVYQNTHPSANGKKSGWLHLFFPLTSFPVNSIKITLNTAAITGWSHIDAVGISNSKTPINPQINVIKQIQRWETTKTALAFNSEADELFPVFSLHGQRMYFSRRYHPENTNDIDLDIWYTDKVAEEWVTPKKAGSSLNNSNHNYICAASADDHTLYLVDTYSSDLIPQTGVSKATWENRKWGKPQPIVIEGFHNYHPFFEFFVSQDAKVMILAIEMEDTYGGRDLYVSHKLKDGWWSKPLNLGPTINSADDEFSPFLAPDDKTLYFSSLGFPGYGSADIYKSVRTSGRWQSWSEVENLGPSFNSENWDSSFSIDPESEKAYFVSYHQSINNSADIFSVNLPINLKPTPQVLLSGVVLDAKENAPIKSEIIFDRLSDGQEFTRIVSNPGTGYFESILPANEKYSYWAKAKGYVSVGELVDLTEFSSYAEINKNLYLVPLEVGQLVRLNNIFFEQSQYDLLPESFIELNRFAQTLLDNPTVEVILEGHTDLAGDPRQNMQLSRKRVEEVKEYLTAQGVSAKRIETKAFGSTRPLSKERTPDARRKNRRVEFRIKKM